MAKPSKKDKAAWEEQDRVTQVPDKEPARAKSQPERQQDRQRDKQRAQNDNAAVDAAKKLDPNDQSERARYLREVAESVEDHRSSRDHDS
jgi:acyl-CoA reductase-like NAD-dependent aldehyde dehydrogenase